MRVYELAKKMQVSSAEIIERAQKLDVETYSSLSNLDESDVKKIEASLAKRTVDQIRGGKLKRDEMLAKKKAAARKAADDKSQANREALAKNREAAVKAAEADAARKAGKRTETVEPAAKPAPVAETKPAAEPMAKTESAVSTATAAKPQEAKAPAKPAKPKTTRIVDEFDDPDEEKARPFLDRISRRESAHDFGKAQGKRTNDERVERNRERERGVRPPADLPRGGFGQRNTAQQPSGRQMPGMRGGMQQRTGWGQQNNQRGGVRQNGNRRDDRFNRNVPNAPRPQQTAATPQPANPDADHVITLQGAVVIKDLAEKLNIRANRLIADLMALNILASINQRVEIDVAKRIAEKYGFRIELERQKRSTERRPVLRSEDADDMIPDDKPEEMQPRPPVVTFLGHVDHGKTSLMDRIRKAHVASGEAGGITQAISAYHVDINGRRITFIDTPGHAAFSAMRARGANMTDIAVIIVAADDGIMPQTKEAIAQARQAGVQIMVAINKCDLPNAKPDRVRQMLQAENLTPEEWGGDVICCEVSALTGAGIDHLLEMILLQADMLELTANPNRRADGHVVEAELEHGLGPTATLLISGGTLKVGDILLCGQYFGKVKALIDDRGRRIKEAGPSAAIKCMGLSGVPEAGAEFRVMLDEKRARALAKQAAEEHKLQSLTNAKATSLDDLMNRIKEADKRELPVIIKADTQGSEEAIVEALRGIESKKVSLNIIGTGIGNICETDVNNACAGHAIVVGFNIGCESGVQQQARHDGVRISTYRIIYELIDYVKKSMLDLLPPEYKEVVKGHASIKAVFDIGKLGRVAGCQMEDGMLRSKARFRVFRKGEKLWDGKLTSLKHFQQEAAEITGSQECGIHFNGFENFQEGDMVECYELEELPRSL